MASLGSRELLKFPAGLNASDTLINGVHFNLSTLNHYNYTYHSNKTLSNASNCWLVFDDFTPTLLSNGTFVNGTSCYDPYYGIGQRSILSIVFSCLFLASVVFTTVNLRKHGRLFLPSEKRFKAIGRRWQWYWMFFVAACGAISGFTGIDIDRDYLQSISLVLQNFFYFLMIPSTLATVWEGVRHWGSWQERQMVDRDAFSLPQEGTRDRKEFWMPLIFYLFAFLNFFMVIPRNWGIIENQSSDQQTDTDAKPAATDARFKAAAFCALAAWCVICYNLKHSVHYYKPNRGPWNGLTGFLHYVPTKFMLVIPLALVVVGYAAAASFDFDVSPLKWNVSSGWMWGLGQTPIVLILLVFEVHGLIDENEDKVLLRQRRERGRSIDAELGINKKPDWWGKRHGDVQMSSEQRLKALTTEVGGGPATQKNIEQTLEMGQMPTRATVEDPFTDEAAPGGPMSASGDDGRRTVQRMQSTTSSLTATSQAQASRIRSMLDV